MSGYEVANLADTVSKAKAAGATVLVDPYTADGRQAAIISFPGGYIASDSPRADSVISAALGENFRRMSCIPLLPGAVSGDNFEAEVRYGGISSANPIPYALETDWPVGARDSTFAFRNRNWVGFEPAY